MTDDDELPKPAAGWVAHRDPTTYKAAPVPTIKAYKNPNFLSSPHALAHTLPIHPGTSPNPVLGEQQASQHSTAQRQ